MYQSKIIFGPPKLDLYAKAGSTEEDIMWADVVNTTYLNHEQWLSQVMEASFGDLGPLYNKYEIDVAFQADTGSWSE